MESVEDTNITQEYQRKYRTLQEEIETEQERLQMITEKMLGSSKGIGDGMPRGNVKDPDVLVLQLSIKDDLKERLTALNKDERRKRAYIEEELQNKVDNPQERSVIRLYYINRLEWTEVGRVMFSKKQDYYEDEDKYMRRVYRIHGNALEKLDPKKKVPKQTEVNRSK